MGIILVNHHFIATTNAMMGNIIAYWDWYIGNSDGGVGPEIMCGEACEVKLECCVSSIYSGIAVFYPNDNCHLSGTIPGNRNYLHI